MTAPLDYKPRPRERARLKALGLKVTVADTRSAKPPPKTADEFYLSGAWRGLVAAIKKERGLRCEDCGATDQRIIGDHIKELKDGGAPLDRANVRLLCLPCHNRKTAGERTKRLAQPVRPTR